MDVGMRWERLFADLAAELEAEADADIEAEIADRTRGERARLRLVDRLRGSGDLPLDVRVLGVGTVSGVLRGVGPDWCLLHAPGADYVIRLGAVLEIRGLAPHSAAPGSEGPVAARFSLAAVVRRLARDRAVVSLTQVDGGVVTGTVEFAGIDLLEMTYGRADEPDWHRAADSRVRLTVPLEAVAVLRH